MNRDTPSHSDLRKAAEAWRDALLDNGHCGEENAEIRARNDRQDKARRDFLRTWTPDRSVSLLDEISALRGALEKSMESAFYEGYRQGTQANPIWDGDEADKEQDRQWEISHSRAALQHQDPDHD